MRYIADILIALLGILLSRQQCDCFEFNNTFQTGACLSGGLEEGTICELTIRIALSPEKESSKINVQLFTFNLSNSFSFSLPKVTFGKNYAASYVPNIESLVPAPNKKGMTAVSFDIDTGKNILNSGQDMDEDANVIEINVLAGVIDNNKKTDEYWLMASIGLFSDSELWLGGTKFNTIDDLSTVNDVEFHTKDLIYGHGWGIQNVEINQRNPSSKYYNLELIASANHDFFTICSIYIENQNKKFLGQDFEEREDSQYQILKSYRDYFQSNHTSMDNSVKLELGYILRNNTSHLFVTILFKINLEYELLGENLNLSLAATTSYFDNNVKKASVEISIQPKTSVAFNSEKPNIQEFKVRQSKKPNGMVKKNQPFNIIIDIDFPDNSFFGTLEIESDSSLAGRLRFMSVVVDSNGINIPCKQCLGRGKIISNDNMFKWTLENMTTLNFVNDSEKSNDNNNKLSLSLSGMVTDNEANIDQSLITFEYTLSLSNDVIYTDNVEIKVDGSTNDGEKPIDFYVNYAVNPSSVLYYSMPKMIYFDIYTKPGVVYNPTGIVINVPNVNEDSNLPMGSICGIDMVYIGSYVNCQSDISLKPMICPFSYTITANEIMIKLNSTINSAYNTSDNVLDKYGGVIRFKIYYTVTKYEEFDGTATHNLIFGVYQGVNIFAGHLEITVSGNDELNYYEYNGEGYDEKTHINNLLPLNEGVKIKPSEDGLIAYKSQLRVIHLFLGLKPKQIAHNYTIIAKMSNTYQNNPTIPVVALALGKRGKNIVPCHENRMKKQVLNADNFELKGYTQLSNINNEYTKTVTEDDSVDLQFIICPPYNLFAPNLMSIKVYSQETLLQESTLQINLGAGLPNNKEIELDKESSSSTFYCVNTSVKLNGPSVTNSSNIMWKGQTTVLRFDLFINKESNSKLKLTLTNNINEKIDSPNVLEIQRFFVANAGYNYPCVRPDGGLAWNDDQNIYSSIERRDKSNTNNKNEDGSWNYKVGGSLTIERLNYLPFEANNISASTISVEVHVRIPVNSKLNSLNGLKFTLKPTNGGYKGIDKEYDYLTQSLDNFELGSLDEFKSPVDLKNELFSLIMTSDTKKIKKNKPVKVNIEVNIPQFNNIRTIIKFSCSEANKTNPKNKIQFGQLISLKLLRAGRNVDGLMSENNHFGFKANFTSESTHGALAKTFDTATLDLGVVTNTGLGHKYGNYDSKNDDEIVFEAEFYLIDGLHMVNDAEFSYTTTVEFNNDTEKVLRNSSTIIVEEKEHEPKLKMKSSILNHNSDTNIESGNILTFQCEIFHTSKSTANAINLGAIFYFAPYMKIKELKNTSIEGLEYTVKGSSILFTLPEFIKEFHFGLNLNFEFSIIFDPENKYEDIIKKIDLNPTNLPILTLLTFQKHPRAEDSNPANYTYFGESEPKAGLSIKPKAVTLSVSSFKDLYITSEDKCPDKDFPTYGRTLAWYKSGQTYGIYSFKSVKNIQKIKFQQDNGLKTKAIAIKVSYSMDGEFYINLPEIGAGEGVYDFSKVRTIKCRYLRIHITDVNNHNDTFLRRNRATLHKIEIYGEDSTTDLETLPCKVYEENIGGDMHLKMHLKFESIDYFFLCDEELNGKIECFRRVTGQNTHKWLAISKIVSHIVFVMIDRRTDVSHMYAMANDGKSYLRSDNYGETWSYATKLEYETMNADAKQRVKYIRVDLTRRRTSYLNSIYKRI